MDSFFLARGSSGFDRIMTSCVVRLGGARHELGRSLLNVRRKTSTILGSREATSAGPRRAAPA